MEKLNDKLYNWASIIDGETLAQAYRSSSMDFIYPHLALMPDAHLGKGATVGSVIPTKGAIMPAAVGVDIGCGMIAVKTQFYKEEVLAKGALSGLREGIERAIPTSMGRFNSKYTKTAENRIDTLSDRAKNLGFDPANYAANWTLQVGTLGSGNHFIEVSVDENEQVWLFLHSGSRGVGNKLATYHIKNAVDYCRYSRFKLPHPDLAYLEEGTVEFSNYIEQLGWAQEFALANRDEMMDRVVDQFEKFMDERVFKFEQVNCHHNYTVKEEHYGETVWLSRKGAINAAEGVAGLIPGSMGTASYVVSGFGNKLSLNSAPHGAGREYSRGEAKRTFTAEQLEEAMVGIEYRKTDAFIDEIPQAYKPIDTVMNDASDLVEIKHTLHQIVNVKGD